MIEVRIVEEAAGVEAIAAEEDTYLVLSADPEFREPAEHPIRIHKQVHDAQAAEPGSVVVRQGPPLRLLAVVHDLGADPTWREEWVASALTGILTEVEARSIRSLALPPLGTVHGRLRPRRFLELLRDALEAAPSCLARIDIVAPPPHADALAQAIEADGGRLAS